MISYIFSWFERRIDVFKSREFSFDTDVAFRNLLLFVRSEKKHFIVLLLLGSIAGLLDVTLFLVIGWIVDLLISNKPNDLLLEHGTSLIAIGFVVVVLRPCVTILMSLVGEQTIQANFSPVIRWLVHQRIMSQSIDFFQKEFSGNIASKTWQSGQAAAEIVGSLLQIVWSNVVFAASVIALFGWLDWRLGLAIVTWIVLFIVIARIFIPMTRNRSRASAEASNTVNGHLVDTYSNIQTVKLFTDNPTDDAFLRGSLENFISRSKWFLRAVTSARASMSILSSSVLAIIGFISLRLWMGGDLSAGQVAVIFGLILRLDGQLNVLLGLLTNLFRSYGTFQSSISMAIKPVALLDRADATEMKVPSGRVVFNHVSFGYRENTPIFDDLSFTIEPGEKVGLIGYSGAGKSTIVNLLVRFYDTQAGSIGIDGQDIRDVSQSSLRRHIGLVAQDTTLLHRSIRDNIGIGKSDAGLADIMEAARKAHAYDFIQTLVDGHGRQGFDAHVGERGLQLSGGQRQRISIARLMLKNPPILILDEATSALDAKLDVDIQNNLYGMMEGKTVLAIAHRLSTLLRMDRLIVLDKGRLVETGTHEELVSRGGVYAELWHKQFHGGVIDQTAV